MMQNKWTKLGAAAFLSAAVLTACGDEENPVNEGDMEVVPEEDQNTDTDTELDVDQDDTDKEEELDTEMDPDLETDEDSEEE